MREKFKHFCDTANIFKVFCLLRYHLRHTVGIQFYLLVLYKSSIYRPLSSGMLQ